MPRSGPTPLLDEADAEEKKGENKRQVVNNVVQPDQPARKTLLPA
jgi:hypothetical protein